MAAPILKAETILFDYVGDGAAKDVLGFSAEQLYAIDPHLVNLDREGRPDSIRVIAFLAHIIVAMQAQQKQLDAQQKQIDAGRLTASRVAALEALPAKRRRRP